MSQQNRVDHNPNRLIGSNAALPDGGQRRGLAAPSGSGSTQQANQGNYPIFPRGTYAARMAAKQQAEPQ